MSARPDGDGPLALEPRPQRSQTRRRDWLRWGLVVFLLASCALFVDFGDVASTLAGISLPWLGRSSWR